MALSPVLCTDFHKWMWDERGYSPETRKKYVYRARGADVWMLANRKRSLVFARPADLKMYLFDTLPSATNRNRIRQALLAFYDFIVDEGLIATNPAADLPRLPEPEPIPRALESAQAHAIWVASKSHPMGLIVHALVGIYLWTGVRQTAARLLEWPNVRDGWITVREKGRGGRSKERRLPIHPELDLVLEAWRRQTHDARWVFPSPRRIGHPVSPAWIRYRLYEVGEIVGVHLHPHLFRHTLATEMLETGADIRDVQEFLGHAKLSTTQIYTKVRPARLKETVERVHFAPVATGSE